MDGNQLIAALQELSDLERNLEVECKGERIQGVQLQSDGTGRQIVLTF